MMKNELFILAISYKNMKRREIVFSEIFLNVIGLI